MAGLADHLAAVVFPKRFQRKTEPSPAEMLRRAKTRLGTWREVARAFGASESTVRRWRRGQASPDAGHLELMRAWDASTRLRRGNIPDTVTITWSFDGRTRTIDQTNLSLAAGTMNRVRDAWKAGGPNAGAAAFIRGIGDYWYRTHFAGYQALEHARAVGAVADDAGGGDLGAEQFDIPGGAFGDDDDTDPDWEGWDELGVTWEDLYDEAAGSIAEDGSYLDMSISGMTA